MVARRISREQLLRVVACEPPWSMGREIVSQDGSAVHVWAELTGEERDHRWECLLCGRELPRHPYARTRVFRCAAPWDTPHVYLHVPLPRVKCPVHGIQGAPVSWLSDPIRWELLPLGYCFPPAESPWVH